MTELALERDQRLTLKAQSHHLNPVVLLGAEGLTAAVMKEIDRALVAHELIKVRIPDDDRDEREQSSARIADELNAARVVTIGKVVVLYRPRPNEDDAVSHPGGAGPVGATEGPTAPARSPKAPSRSPVSPRGPAHGQASRTPNRNEIRRIGRTVAPRRSGGGGRGS